MNRRGFLLSTGVVLVAGCARSAPPDLATTTPSTSAVPLAIGDDGTPAGAMLAQLLCQAVRASGGAAVLAPIGEDWQASLADGSIAAVPAFAVTLWSQLSEGSDPPDGVDALLSDVAGLLAPEVSVLGAAGVDGGLVWEVTGKTAADGITSLDRIAGWSKGKVVAIPPVAGSRADGIPGIKGVYRGAFTTARLADPTQRAAQLVAGQVALAAFRRTEFTGVANLVTLEDPDEIGLADPLVVLLDAALADADPGAVLAMNGVAGVLTTVMLVELQAKVAGGAGAAEVAGTWLVSQGLA